jgi:hypothetical protein
MLTGADVLVPILYLPHDDYTYEEDEEAEFPGALLQGEHDRLQAGRVPGTKISKEDCTFWLVLEFRHPS